MAYLIAIDDGHGMETAGKRTPMFPDGRVIRENEFNSPTAKLFALEMERCGCNIIFTAPTDTDTSLGERARVANDAKADIFVSFHYNAFTGVWESSKGGVSTHYYINSIKSKKLAELVQAQLIKGTPQIDRKIQGGNLYVCKYTNMPAVLIEAGFMDVSKEANLMLDVNFQKEVAREVAMGVCEYLGIPYVQEDEAKVETPSSNQESVPTPTPIVEPKNTIAFNANVLDVQKKLNKMKIANLDEDGFLGPLTTNAIKKFQEITHASVDGIVGQNTLYRMNEILSMPLCSISNKNHTFAIMYIQWRVGVDNDGVFGNMTKSAVIKWQGKNGLSADGIVGRNTWSKLL